MSIYDYLTIDQGCDGSKGQIAGNSTCTIDANGINTGGMNCMACPAGSGPTTADKNCYRNPSMGTCNNTAWGLLVAIELELRAPRLRSRHQHGGFLARRYQHGGPVPLHDQEALSRAARFAFGASRRGLAQPPHP